VRVVLDTNILISATFWAGKPKQIINMVRRGEIRFLTSRSLLDELKEILVRDDKPFRLSDAEASYIVKTIEDLAEIVQPRCNINACTHEADNRVLEIAMEGKAKWIITGDSHLLDLVSYEGIGIVTASEFIIR
jgi:putative PIN family toxin of toxin-antitoxin system